MSEKISSKNSITPSSIMNTDLLEHPAGIRAVAVRHEHGGFNFLVQRQETLGEDFAVGCVEVALGVAYSLRRVILFLRHVSPEVRWRLWLRLWRHRRPRPGRSLKVGQNFSGR
ncbi:hypothetical protein SLA2020_436860 [Shorea laevis]